MASVPAKDFIVTCKRALAREHDINDDDSTVRLYGGPGERTIDLGDDYVDGAHEVAKVLRALADYVETPVR